MSVAFGTFAHNLAFCTRIAKLRRGKWTWRGVPQVPLTWMTTSSLFNPINIPTVGWFFPVHCKTRTSLDSEYEISTYRYR